MNTPLAMLVMTLLAIEGPVPLPEPPGGGFDVPERSRAVGAPVVHSHSAEAGPDQSFLLVGEGFTDKLAAWGSHPESETGRAIAPQVQLVDDRSLIATLPERAYDGPIVVWAENEKGFSEPVVLNAPEPWWCLPVAAGPRNVTLPARLAPTPEEHLGSVARERLAYDAEGNETPFWPPEVDQGTTEPTVGEYFVTVLRGRGMGQTRRVLARQGETYELDQPWRVAPESDGPILVHTAFWRNHIIGNRTVDGMTGIQLWISCIENIVSDNVVARMRKPAVYLYGNCSTLASSMPTTWNRGIGPLYFNHIEGTRSKESTDRPTGGSSRSSVACRRREPLRAGFPGCTRA